MAGPKNVEKPARIETATMTVVGASSIRPPSQTSMSPQPGEIGGRSRTILAVEAIGR